MATLQKNIFQERKEIDIWKTFVQLIESFCWELFPWSFAISFSDRLLVQKIGCRRQQDPKTKENKLTINKTLQISSSFYTFDLLLK
jgi:hypothetical protein